MPVAGCTVRGLPPVYPACNLKRGRLPAWIWDAIVWAAHVGYMRGREVLLAVTFDPSVGYRLPVPPQVAGPERVVYRPTANAVLEIHSHGPLAAVFSSTDDRDEQGLRLYGVVGRLGTERPEVALRVGAYGHFLPVAWETVFDGNRQRFGMQASARLPRTTGSMPYLIDAASDQSGVGQREREVTIVLVGCGGTGGFPGRSDLSIAHRTSSTALPGRS